MNYATTRKKTPPCPPSLSDTNPTAHHVPHLGDGFFPLMVKAAGITRKELQFDMRFSKTYVDLIMAGEKHDPVSRARVFCAMLRKRNRMDLVAATIVHIAGGDDFDGRVLTATQVEALKELAKVVK